jgi:hypothetical protein
MESHNHDEGYVGERGEEVGKRVILSREDDEGSRDG